MPVEDRKDTIAFIICVNNELYFEECRYYIEQDVYKRQMQIIISRCRTFSTMRK